MHESLGGTRFGLRADYFLGYSLVGHLTVYTLSRVNSTSSSFFIFYFCCYFSLLLSGAASWPQPQDVRSTWGVLYEAEEGNQNNSLCFISRDLFDIIGDTEVDLNKDRSSPAMGISGGQYPTGAKRGVEADQLMLFLGAKWLALDRLVFFPLRS
jgi:hypothetical protein